MQRLVYLAAGPGEQAYKFFSEQIGPLFMLALGAMAVWFFFKSEYTRFIQTAVFAIFASAFVFIPEKVSDMAVFLFEKIFGGWFK